MPGFNQRGPMNEGPMTGRGRGNCTTGANTGKGVAGRPDTIRYGAVGYGGMGYGMGMARRRGRCGDPAPGWGRGQGRWAGPEPMAASPSENELVTRTNMLEAELAALKQQLKDLSESRE